ncbi:unnamed protein product, partial [Ectocarpus fasciculatus]
MRSPVRRKRRSSSRVHAGWTYASIGKGQVLWYCPPGGGKDDRCGSKPQLNSYWARNGGKPPKDDQFTFKTVDAPPHWKEIEVNSDGEEEDEQEDQQSSNGASVGGGGDGNCRVEGTLGGSSSSTEGLSGSSPAGKARRGRSQDTGTQQTGIPRAGGGSPDEDADCPGPGAVAQGEMEDEVPREEREEDNDEDETPSEENEEDDDDDDDDDVDPLPIGGTQLDQSSAAPGEDAGARPTALDEERAEEERDDGGSGDDAGEVDHRCAGSVGEWMVQPSSNDN